MRFLASFLFVCLLAVSLRAEVALTPAQQAFRSELAGKVAALEKQNLGAATGADGWLFLVSELRFLAQGRFWGDAAAKVSRARKPDTADPIPAIVDFHRQLKERGIDLLLVPVPPKAAIYPEKLGLNLPPAESAPFLQAFYDELRARGIEVLDLTPLFLRNRESTRGAVDCKTDSHWSGVGCALAGEAIAQQIKARLTSLPPRSEFTQQWGNINIIGDLAALTGEKGNPPSERLAIRQVTPAVQADPRSPVLLLGDSHTLVFHDFLAERAGLLDQLAFELGFAPDLIGTRGSGATAVRVSLYRRSRSEPDFLAQKKIVVWCFAARDFTEADQGWVVQPISAR